MPPAKSNGFGSEKLARNSVLMVKWTECATGSRQDSQCLELLRTNVIYGIDIFPNRIA